MKAAVDSFIRHTNLEYDKNKELSIDGIFIRKLTQKNVPLVQYWLDSNIIVINHERMFGEICASVRYTLTDEAKDLIKFILLL